MKGTMPPRSHLLDNFISNIETGVCKNKPLNLVHTENYKHLIMLKKKFNICFLIDQLLLRAAASWL